MNAFLNYCFSPETSSHLWEEAIDKGFEKGMKYATLSEVARASYRTELYLQILFGQFTFDTPYAKDIPKKGIDPVTGKQKTRTVYISPQPNRLLFSVCNSALFELFSDMVHPSCMSYRKHVSCGDTVKAFADEIEMSDGIVGWKSDLKKYFDNVPVRYIDRVFDKIRSRIGEDRLLDALQQYYHTNLYYSDHRKRTLIEEYRSLKQGCAVASFFADAILYPIDQALSSLDVRYVRYCDDQICIGRQQQQAFDIMKRMLREMDMTINEDKLEWIDRKHWVCFLGFSVRGSNISISESELEKMKKSIGKILSGGRNEKSNRWEYPSFHSAIREVNRILYNPKGRHGWATRVLRYINVDADIDTLNEYIMDVIRAAKTGRRKIGGIGYAQGLPNGCLCRGRGKNVSTNRQRTDEKIEGYYTLRTMKNALHSSRDIYNVLLAELN